MDKQESNKGLWGAIKAFLKNRLSGHRPEDIAEEIQEIIDEGQAKGLITDEESEMVLGVLELKDTKASSIMVPRISMVSAPSTSSVGDVISLIKECGYTRIPIYGNSLDDIVGILHAKDLLILWGHDLESTIPKEILRPPFFAPHNKRVIELLRDLKENKMHMAILTDEYGGTVGIVTIEDILEEIVGEIQDEYDREEPLYSSQPDGGLLVDGRMDAEELAEQLGLELPEGDFESIAGFIITHVGKIPPQGEKITYGGYEFIIQKADQRKIYKLIIRPLASKTDETKD